MNGTAVPVGGGYEHQIRTRLDSGQVIAWCGQAFSPGGTPAVGPCPQCQRAREKPMDTGNSGSH
ncbi:MULTISPECIES: hypothetical protein [unclassified Crossiella]|uniref:hypothetical protein n=1 Tax=unclassified Crossiella TaxID=2620835 RepID=UPI001FFF4ABC|nr:MULTISPECIES: hypothetical protein [unclassified Crossiella]MCK2241887.1 hypothetical protein [Crossiella sp. S99.2]MCK2255790.1 hypothetical protein [Crossiella sp. S99.1]